MRLSVVPIRLIVGLIATLVVAWWCALRSTSYAPIRQPVVPADAMRPRLETMGWMPIATPRRTLITSGNAFRGDAAAEQEVLQQFRTEGFGISVTDVYEAFGHEGRTISGVAFSDGYGFTGARIASVIEAGWPRPALAGARVRPTRAPSWQPRSAIAPPGLLSRWAREDRVLPLRPIWSGIVIDTAVFATAAGVLCAVMVFVRGHVRMRRGQCPRCAYPRGESEACSECGRAVRRPATTAADPAASSPAS